MPLYLFRRLVHQVLKLNVSEPKNIILSEGLRLSIFWVQALTKVSLPFTNPSISFTGSIVVTSATGGANSEDIGGIVLGYKGTDEDLSISK